MIYTNEIAERIASSMKVETTDDYMPQETHAGINTMVFDIISNSMLEEIINKFYEKYDVIDIKFGVINRICGWKTNDADTKYSVMIIFKERVDK